MKNSKSQSIAFDRCCFNGKNKDLAVQGQGYCHLTITGEDSKLVHRRNRPKVDTLFSSLFSDAPSDEYDSAPSRKYSRPLLDVFACIGYNDEYKNILSHRKYYYSAHNRKNVSSCILRFFFEKPFLLHCFYLIKLYESYKRST